MASQTTPCYFADIMDAIATVIQVATTLNAAVILEDQNPTENVLRGKEYFVYRVGAYKPDSYGGAGRLATTMSATIEIVPYTRYAVDKAARTYKWNRLHWIRELQIINALHARYLWSGTPDIPWADPPSEPTGNRLTRNPVHFESGPGPVVGREKDPTFGASVLSFTVDFVLNLNNPTTDFGFLDE